MTSRDIMIQTDVDGSGGLLVLRDGNDPEFIKRTIKNSVKCTGVMAQILKIMRDDIIAIQNSQPGGKGDPEKSWYEGKRKPLATKKGRA